MLSVVDKSTSNVTVNQMLYVSIIYWSLELAFADASSAEINEINVVNIKASAAEPLAHRKNIM